MQLILSMIIKIYMDICRLLWRIVKHLNPVAVYPFYIDTLRVFHWNFLLNTVFLSTSLVPEKISSCGFSAQQSIITERTLLQHFKK